MRSSLAVPITLADGEIAGGLCFGHPEPASSTPRPEAAAEHHVRGGRRDRQRAAARVRTAGDRRARGRAAPARPGRRRAAAEPAPAGAAADPGLELGAHYHAGTELVGGDFYDVFALADTMWGIVLGDVCGSGPEAASQTALTRHTVRTAAMFDAAPATVLHALNRALLRANTKRFTTAVFLRLDLAGEPGEIVTSIARRPPARADRQRADGRIEETARPRHPARRHGLPDRGRCTSPSTACAAGDTLILYTDGLTEARRDRRAVRRRRREGDAPRAARRASTETSPTASSPPRSSTPTRR